MAKKTSGPPVRPEPKFKQHMDSVKLTPGQVSAMRRRLFEHVDDQVDEAHKVVMGKKQWSPTQARVFSTMLNKVMPDLTASFTQHEHMVSDDPQKLSRAQLEAIASTMGDIIEGDATEADD